MRNNYGSDTQYPTVNLAVRKSRLKLYDNKSEFPTYFLRKGQEFQIELFNPTKFVMLAKIKLNGNAISGGGLVLQPGQRIFLERFLEENKKFLFETYQVDNIAAVKKAIEENGDLSVDFYREQQPITQDLHAFHGSIDFPPPGTYTSGTDKTFLTNSGVGNIGLTHLGRSGYAAGGGGGGGSKDILSTTNSSASVTLDSGSSDTTTTNTLIGSNMTYSHDLDLGEVAVASGSIDVSGTLDLVPSEQLRMSAKKSKKRRRIKKSKSIETGRVTKGSASSQKLEQVDLDFEWNVYHTVSYKMLPLSQKRYSTKEITQHYCGDCGKKLKPRHKFCPNCGEEQ
jgi:hypothetical protein